MSMLAEPRRKQKVINLRAKNNAWSNDANKFGQRMLEKMGWSSGKGLGANENGIVDHVVARYKNDEKGLGFKDKNDQWTKHEDDFNTLLANLSNDGSSTEKIHSGISLEVKSKTSKVRVHYHKFTRGKDLTRYSEKDLANIFGKKSLKIKDKICEEAPKEVIQISEQIFTEKGSMEDYFKSKLASCKAKNNMVLTMNKEDDSVDYAFRGFSTNNDEIVVTQGFGCQVFPTDNDQNSKVYEENISVSYNSQKCDPEVIFEKKKNKKSKDKLSTNKSIIEHPEPVTKKKEKKKKAPIETVITDSINLDRKKKKRHLDVPVELNDLEETVQEMTRAKKLKKKTNNVQEVKIEETQEKRKITHSIETLIPDSINVDIKKKKKRLDICIELNDLDETTLEKVIVKKSKKKNVEDVKNDLTHDTTDGNECLPKKKKRRKNKEKEIEN